MKKILKWFTPVLALGVAIFIIFFFISINSSQEYREIEPLTYKSKVLEDKPKKIWLNHFSKTERLGYFYPVNEVYVDVDLINKISTDTLYKLSASFLDPYQVFCLKEELRQHKIKYSLKKDKNGVELFVFSKSVEELNSLVKVLKNYQISATIKPYKEEV